MDKIIESLKSIFVVSILLIGLTLLWPHRIAVIEFWSSYRIFSISIICVLVLALLFINGSLTKILNAGEDKVASSFLLRFSKDNILFKRKFIRKISKKYEVFNVQGTGLMVDRPLSLWAIYIDLVLVFLDNPLDPEMNPIGFKRQIEGVSIWDLIDSKDDNEINWAYVVSGPPGCGKTTLLHHVVLSLTRKDSLRRSFISYVPILLPLRYVSDLISKESLSLVELIQKYYSDQKQYPSLNPPPNWFGRQIERGRCVILLDGLDEVGDLEQRRSVSNWVDSQIENYDKCRFILTTRPLGYKDAPLKRGQMLEVQKLSWEQIEEFVHKWVSAHERQNSQKNNLEYADVQTKSKGDDLVEQLRSTTSLIDLAVNPLLLTIICIIHRYHKFLPNNRAELYNQICNTLLSGWQSAKGLQSNLSADSFLKVLIPIANDMMNRLTRDIDEVTLVTQLSAAIQNAKIPEVITVDEIVHHLHYNGILVERGPGIWSFSHFTLQEYLTARNWKTGSDDQQWRKYIADDWWLEVLRFYALIDNPNPIAVDCLAADTVTSLTLAYHILLESTNLTSETKKRIEEKAIADIEYRQSDRVNIAAEIRIRMRINSMIAVNEESEIDLHYLTNGEYMLFVRHMTAMGRVVVPDNWGNSVFIPGTGLAPVAGVNPFSALAFCGWLTHWLGGDWIYSLPPRFIADRFNSNSGDVSAWCLDGSKFSLTSLDSSVDSAFTGILQFNSPKDIQLPHSLDLDKARSIILEINERNDRDDGTKSMTGTIQNLMDIQPFIDQSVDAVIQYAAERLLNSLDLSGVMVDKFARVLLLLISVPTSHHYGYSFSEDRRYSLHFLFLICAGLSRKINDSRLQNLISSLGDLSDRLGGMNSILNNDLLDSLRSARMVLIGIIGGFQDDRSLLTKSLLAILDVVIVASDDLRKIDKDLEREIGQLVSELSISEHIVYVRIGKIIKTIYEIGTTGMHPAWIAHRSLCAFIFECAVLGNDLAEQLTYPYYNEVIEQGGAQSEQAEGVKEILNELYWWFKIVWLRSVEQIPAWEGVRLYRTKKS